MILNPSVYKRILGVLLVTVGIVALAGTWLFAAGDTKKVIVKADHVASKKENGTVQVTTYNKAIITQEESVFTADTVVQRSQNNVHEFTCTGNPVYQDQESNITSETVTAYSSPRRAMFNNNVKMVCTPKKKQNDSDVKKEMSSEPSTITCNKLDYDYAAKKALGTGNVVVVQKDRTVWADQGIYDQNSELVTLQGNVRMKNAGKEEIKEMSDAQTVTVSLENDFIDIVAKPGGKVTMVFEVPEDEAPSSATKTNPPKK